MVESSAFSVFVMSKSSNFIYSYFNFNLINSKKFIISNKVMCTYSSIISLFPLSLANTCGWLTPGASGHWLGTQTGAGGTIILAYRFFWPQPMAPLIAVMCRQIFHVEKTFFMLNNFKNEMFWTHWELFFALQKCNRKIKKIKTWKLNSFM